VLSSIHDPSTWEPLVRLLLDREAAAPGGLLTGRIRPGSWSLPKSDRRLGRAMLSGLQSQFLANIQDERDAVEPVIQALKSDGLDDVLFILEKAAGRALLSLRLPSPAVQSGITGDLGALILVDGAIPAPWRRRPEPTPDAVPAPSADPELLERTLREQLPDATAATDEEIAAAEARLGIALPDELKAVYRVVRERPEPWGEEEDEDQEGEKWAGVLGFDLFGPDQLQVFEPASRYSPWEHAATEAAVTVPGAAVQGLVGSPGWIVFGVDGGGDYYAVDLTPAPGGHLGQIIFLFHEEQVGAHLVAESLTDMVVHKRAANDDDIPRADEPPYVAYVNDGGLRSTAAAADPRLEVLCIGTWSGERLSLAPVFGLPRLRTLTAYPGTLADPTEIGRLTGLEFLSVGPAEWRTLLDADAVPRTLAAAAIVEHSHGAGLYEIEALANEILASFGRPQITRFTLEFDLA
jgi:cell wall assembly regulator SMI1